MKELIKNKTIHHARSHAELINRTIGTTHTIYRKSTIDMSEFGVPGVQAWFVFMDGTPHGYDDGWWWENLLSPDGSEIIEMHISSQKNDLFQKRRKDGFYPFRLCFQLDPYENRNRHCCKFVGAFRLDSFLKEDLSVVKYVKVLDDFNIGSKGVDYNQLLNSKNDFLNSFEKYFTSIDSLGFSNETLAMLKKSNIKYIGELLEIGLGEEDLLIPKIFEIYKKLFEVFS